MNASIGAAQDTWSIQTWEEPSYSPLPTLVATAFTALALLVALITASDGWRYLTPDAVPSGSRVVSLTRASGTPVISNPVLTYFIVASEEQEARAHELIALAWLEQANGLGPEAGPQPLVRWAHTPEAEAATLDELNVATESWVGHGGAVKVIDLR